MGVGTMNTEKCKRCNGTGHLQAYRHVDNGTCFSCGGTGRVSAETGAPTLVLCAAAQAAVNAEAAVAFKVASEAADARRAEGSATAATEGVDFLALLK